MNSYAKFLTIHALSFLCIFMADQAFARVDPDTQIDTRILTPIEGWAAPQASNETLEQKYSQVLEHFAGTKMAPVVKTALEFIENNSSKITNKDYLTLIDYGKSAETKRFYVINLRTGEFNKYNVSNGRGSDQNHDGIAESFSNQANSFQTSLGFYLTTDDYFSEKFDSTALRLEGLSQTNSAAMERAIVIHGASYMDPEKGLYGRSLGCPALDKDVAETVISKIKDGSLILAYKQ